MKINEYLHYDRKVPIIVLWNGSTDLLYNKITKTYKHSKGVRYDDGNDNFYNLKLINLVNNKIVLLSP